MMNSLKCLSTEYTQANNPHVSRHFIRDTIRLILFTNNLGINVWFWDVNNSIMLLTSLIVIICEWPVHYTIVYFAFCVFGCGAVVSASAVEGSYKMRKCESAKVRKWTCIKCESRIMRKWCESVYTMRKMKMRK